MANAVIDSVDEVSITGGCKPRYNAQRKQNCRKQAQHQIVGLQRNAAEFGSNELSDRNRRTPLRFQQSILQKVVVPACPIPSFSLMALLQKAELLEQCERRRIVSVYLRLDSIELHLSETPGDDSVQRLLCVPMPLIRRRDFVSYNARPPASIPAKQAARSNQSWLVFQLHGPTRPGDGLFTPARKRSY